MLLQTLCGTLQLIDRPDEILLRLRLGLVFEPTLPTNF
jgi:hypothetical protein